MVPEKFRRQLRQEAEQWWSEGLIDASLYEKLSERYQFSALERDASHRFIAILMGLGSILLGLAAITFVAANWEAWSRPVKIIFLLSLLVGVDTAGFYLWRKPATLKGQQRLGQGLLLLGALLLGANLALLSQMFHQSGPIYQLFLVWAVGVLAMAYSLRLTSLGVVSIILFGIAYWVGWLTQLGSSSGDFWQIWIQHMPLFASIALIPLAYWCRSRVIFTLGALLVSLTLALNMSWVAQGEAFGFGWLMSLAYALPPALLWGYSDRLWRITTVPLRDSHPPDAFPAIARTIALWGLSFNLYMLSFRWLWNDTGATPSGVRTWNWHLLFDLFIFAVITGLGWLQLRHDFRGNWAQTRSLNSGTIAFVLVSMAIALIWTFDVSPLQGWGVFLANLLLFLLAIGLIRDGLALGSRNQFWGGMVLLVLGIITRMLEYDTGLLLKSIAFALCGLGVIAAGLWFERNVKPAATPSSPRSL